MIQARLILEELKKQNVTHVVGLPDNSSAKLFDLLGRDCAIRLVPVTREGEAFAIAAGLWIGGMRPVVLVQNTGFFESGDSFRGTITRMRIPLVCMITYRGYRKMACLTAEPADLLDPETLSHAPLDSAALVTEPTLKAWGLPYDFLHTDADVSCISNAFLKARDRRQPFAILITQGVA